MILSIFKTWWIRL
jgi:hypothetical protein